MSEHEELIKKASIGDRIRIIEDQFGAKVGDIVTVTSSHSDRVYYAYAGCGYIASHGCYEIVDA